MIVPMPEIAASPSLARAGRVARGVLRVATYVAFGLFSVLVVLLVVIALLPRLTPIEFVIVGGGSMEPTIPFGSVAVMRAIDGRDVEPGMIIKFRAENGRMVTHRAMSIDPATGNITTRGDNNPSDDLRPVRPQQVEARYLFNVPRVGSFMHWASSREGIMVFVLVPGTLIIAGEVVSIARTVRDERRKKRSSLAGESHEPVLRHARMRDQHGTDEG
jgi:signal peptidase